MDYIIYAIVIYLVLEILKIKNISYAIKILEFWQGSVFEGYITGMLLVIISMLINTIFIYCFGNTLGKRICGIKIVNINNLSYSFSTLIKREILVITRGSAYLLPLLNELVYYLLYKRLVSTNSTIWDKQLNFKIIYKPRKLWVSIITILPLVLYMCFAYWILYSEIFNFFNTYNAQ